MGLRSIFQDVKLIGIRQLETKTWRTWWGEGKPTQYVKHCLENELLATRVIYCPDRIAVGLEDQTICPDWFVQISCSQERTYLLVIFLSSWVRIFLEQTSESCWYRWAQCSVLITKLCGCGWVQFSNQTVMDYTCINSHSQGYFFFFISKKPFDILIL